MQDLGWSCRLVSNQASAASVAPNGRENRGTRQVARTRKVQVFDMPVSAEHGCLKQGIRISG